MEGQKTEKVNYNSLIIPGSQRTRFSDCCNAEIINNRCPKCGRWLPAPSDGRHEIIIKGLDGKTPGLQHQQKTPTPPVAMVSDKPKPADKLPPLFRDMRDRGVKILNWSDTSSSNSSG